MKLSEQVCGKDIMMPELDATVLICVWKARSLPRRKGARIQPWCTLAVKHSETSTGGARNAGCMTAHRQRDLSPSSSPGAEHKEKEHIRGM